MPYIYSDLDGYGVYESGLDHGVLYLSSGQAVPWNGLVEVTQDNAIRSEPAYYAGRKAHDITGLLPFRAEVKAITYPKELRAFNQPAQGWVIENQKKPIFGLAWREKFSDGGYRYYIAGNLTFVETTTEHETTSDKPNVVEFTWEISAPRIVVDGFPPVAIVNIDTRTADSNFLLWLEEILYGSDTQAPGFTTFEDFLTDLVNYVRLTVVDNGDGTWTANTGYDYITVGINDFTIDHPYGIQLNPHRYRIGDF